MLLIIYYAIFFIKKEKKVYQSQTGYISFIYYICFLLSISWNKITKKAISEH